MESLRARPALTVTPHSKTCSLSFDPRQSRSTLRRPSVNVTVKDLPVRFATPKPVAVAKKQRNGRVSTLGLNHTVPETAELLWKTKPNSLPGVRPTAPVAVAGLVLSAGSDGVVRAVDGQTGNERWKAYTGGAIRIPPTVHKGRALVGSADGWVYCLRADDGVYELSWSEVDLLLETAIRPWDDLLDALIRSLPEDNSDERAPAPTATVDS